MYSFILWNVSPDLFSLGSFSLRWYGLLFAIGFLIGQQLLLWFYKKEGKNQRDIESMTIYMLVGTVVGARLGHCLFYEPAYFLAHPLEILYIWQGGLASHGATLGIIVALYLYSRKHKDQSFIYIADRVVIGVAIGASLIRMGNMMNSEIIGKPTDSPSGFLFMHGIEENLTPVLGNMVENITLAQIDSAFIFGDKTVQTVEVTLHMTALGNGDIRDVLQYGVKEALTNSYDYQEEKFLLPEQLKFSESTNEQGKKTVLFKVYGVARHPAQLYESITMFVLFLILLGMYVKHDGNVPTGRILGWFMVFTFTLRFSYELIKVNQVSFEEGMSLNMGQILSIPLILAGLYILMRSYRGKKEIS